MFSDLLKDFYTVYRLDPPSIGLTKLSSKVTESENPIPSSPPILTTLPSAAVQGATISVLYTPAPYPTAATLGPADYLARYWDPTSYSLPLEPFPSVQPPSHRPLSLAKGTTRLTAVHIQEQKLQFQLQPLFSPFFGLF